jgi:hypothetical protein
MLSRYAFAGAFLFLLVSTLASSALAVSGLQPSLTFPHLSFTSYAAGPQSSSLISKHVDRRASPPVVPPSLLRSWADVARVHPGNTVAFHYVVTNPSSRAVPVSLTASLMASLSLGTSGTASNLSIVRAVLLPPGRSTQFATLPVPAGLQFGTYYLSLTLFNSDTGGSQSLVDGAVTLQVSR